MIKRRGRSRFPKQRDPDYKKFIVGLGVCIVGAFGYQPTPCWGPIDPGHLRPQSLGSPDRKNLFPVCRKHHGEQEGHRRDFERRYRLDLADIVVYLDHAYQRDPEAALEYLTHSPPADKLAAD